MTQKALRTVSLVLLLGAMQQAPENRNAARLATMLGIGIAEAEARLRLADRLGIFQLRVRSDPDFAGAYFEHEPKVQAVVMFKGDAAAKLKRYVDDNAFVARGADYSLAELAEAGSAAAKAFEAAGLVPAGIEPDIEANRVAAFFVDAAPARAAIASGRLTLPKPVVIAAIEAGTAVTETGPGPY